MFRTRSVAQRSSRDMFQFGGIVRETNRLLVLSSPTGLIEKIITRVFKTQSVLSVSVQGILLSIGLWSCKSFAVAKAATGAPAGGCGGRPNQLCTWKFCLMLVSLGRLLEQMGNWDRGEANEMLVGGNLSFLLIAWKTSGTSWYYYLSVKCLATTAIFCFSAFNRQPSMPRPLSHSRCMCFCPFIWINHCQQQLQSLGSALERCEY
jgi:hypothetical protein